MIFKKDYFEKFKLKKFNFNECRIKRFGPKKTFETFSKMPVDILEKIDRLHLLTASSIKSMKKNINKKVIVIKNYISFGIFTQTISFNYLLSIFFRISGYFLLTLFIIFLIFQYCVINLNFCLLIIPLFNLFKFLIPFFFSLFIFFIFYHLIIGLKHIKNK